MTFGNLEKSPTCFKDIKLKGTLIGVLLANKSDYFQKTIVCGTGVSDHYMLAIIIIIFIILNILRGINLSVGNLL